VKRAIFAAASLDELHHQVGRPCVADEPGGARRGLRRRLVAVDEHDVAHTSTDEVECGRRAEAAGADDDDVGPLGHGYPPMSSTR
jgi:hypothetical protein